MSSVRECLGCGTLQTPQWVCEHCCEGLLHSFSASRTTAGRAQQNVKKLRATLFALKLCRLGSLVFGVGIPVIGVGILVYVTRGRIIALLGKWLEQFSLFVQLDLVVLWTVVIAVGLVWGTRLAKNLERWMVRAILVEPSLAKLPWSEKVKHRWTTMRSFFLTPAFFALGVLVMATLWLPGALPPTNRWIGAGWLTLSLMWNAIVVGAGLGQFYYTDWLPRCERMAACLPQRAFASRDA